VSNVIFIVKGTDEAMEEIRQKIRKYILDSFLFTAKEDSLDNDKSFLQNGIIDSTGILEVIGFIEEEFGIKVEDEEIVPANLDSINLISGYITRKRAS
jgi:acyl carrier protein